mmetsp:Transcript_52431/g.162738  ORF Transcript_52431/g.162738 Transcript_52431/m.162738 type:complete len:154 (-) Transcript_52431:92-553(-)
MLARPYGAAGSSGMPGARLSSSPETLRTALYDRVPGAVKAETCRQVFEEIRRRVGKIHCSLIPIGAYLPRKFMKDHHASPEDAVQIHLALGSSWSVGCHWGTLRQKALEHVLDPPKVVQAELERRKMKPTDFEVMKHGETRGIVVQGGMVSKI